MYICDLMDNVVENRSEKLSLSQVPRKVCDSTLGDSWHVKTRCDSRCGRAGPRFTTWWGHIQMAIVYLKCDQKNAAKVKTWPSVHISPWLWNPVWIHALLSNISLQCTAVADCRKWACPIPLHIFSFPNAWLVKPGNYFIFCAGLYSRRDTEMKCLSEAAQPKESRPDQLFGQKRDTMWMFSLVLIQEYLFTAKAGERY